MTEESGTKVNEFEEGSMLDDDLLDDEGGGLDDVALIGDGASPPRGVARSSAAADSKTSTGTGYFQKEVAALLYGFGDDPTDSSSETVQLVEQVSAHGAGSIMHLDRVRQIAVDFIVDLAQQALTANIGHATPSAGGSKSSSAAAGRIQVEDVYFVVRKDKRKFSRVKELLMMSEKLKKARKAFDEQKFVKDATVAAAGGAANEPAVKKPKHS